MVIRESDLRPSYRREEQNTLNAILDWLMVMGIPHVHHRNVPKIIRKPGGQIIFGKEKYSQSGAPDLFIWWKGRSYAVEVKSSVGKLSPEQTEWMWRFEQRGGGTPIVAKSLDDFLQQFER